MKEELKAAIRNLIDGEDDTGCDGLTVVEKDAFDKIQTLFESEEESNVKSTHVKTIMLETGEEDVMLSFGSEIVEVKRLTFVESLTVHIGQIEVVELIELLVCIVIGVNTVYVDDFAT